MAYNKGFNPDRLPMHAEPEQVCRVYLTEREFGILTPLRLRK